MVSPNVTVGLTGEFLSIELSVNRRIKPPPVLGVGIAGQWRVADISVSQYADWFLLAYISREHGLTLEYRG
jgi:hypothetical protein